MLDDHAAIRRAAAGEYPLAPADAVALGERLGDHVRFEERVLFEMLERRLSPPELERLGEAVAAAEGDGS